VKAKKRKYPDCSEEVGALLKSIGDERHLLQEAVESSKEKLRGAKSTFAKAKSQPENSKADGQPLRAKIDETLKKYGIDRAAQFGGDIEGNGARKLMSECTDIIGDIEKYVLSLSSTAGVIGTEEQLKDVCEKHRQLFLCLDGYFSGLRTKRFHVTEEITLKTIAFLERSVALERHLCMSITPKTHWMESHSIKQFYALRGFGDLGEDAGEKNHQEESKNDKQVRKNNPATKARILDMKDNSKHSGSANKEVQDLRKRQKRYDDREGALTRQFPSGKITTYKQLRKVVEINDLPVDE